MFLHDQSRESRISLDSADGKNKPDGLEWQKKIQAPIKCLKTKLYDRGNNSLENILDEGELKLRENKSTLNLAENIKGPGLTLPQRTNQVLIQPNNSLIKSSSWNFRATDRKLSFYYALHNLHYTGTVACVYLRGCCNQHSFIIFSLNQKTRNLYWSRFGSVLMVVCFMFNKCFPFLSQK